LLVLLLFLVLYQNYHLDPIMTPACYVNKQV
jgi:hypothetical protein